MPVLITAALCTYNRVDLLAGALQSLCEQSLPPHDYEILVVDNASTDNTRAVVDGIQDQYPGNVISYLYESKQGLGHARNIAFQVAHGRFIAYMDDDAIADPHWLEVALLLFDLPDAPVCVGGQINPFYTTPKPIWYEDKYEIRSWGDQARFLDAGESFSGSNMIWRIGELLSAGGFAVDVGVKGETISVGEETSPFRSLWQKRKGKMFYYSPELRIYHWVPPHKMRVSYHLKRAFVTGQSEFNMLGRFGMAWRALRVVRGVGYIIVRGIIALWRVGSYPYWQNWAVEEGRNIIAKIGLISAALGFQIEIKR